MVKLYSDTCPLAIARAFYTSALVTVGEPHLVCHTEEGVACVHPTLDANHQEFVDCGCPVIESVS